MSHRFGLSPSNHDLLMDKIGMNTDRPLNEREVLHSIAMSHAFRNSGKWDYGEAGKDYDPMRQALEYRDSFNLFKEGPHMLNRSYRESQGDDFLSGQLGGDLLVLTIILRKTIMENGKIQKKLITMKYLKTKIDLEIAKEK